jgi:hypothetical protein
MGVMDIPADTIASLKQTRDGLLAEKDRLQEKIAKIDENLKAIDVLTGLDGGRLFPINTTNRTPVPDGIAEAVRWALSRLNRVASPVDVARYLANHGFQTEAKAPLSAVVSAELNRQHKAPKGRIVRKDRGRYLVKRER